jgi:type IV pilus assembly protein PilF
MRSLVDPHVARALALSLAVSCVGILGCAGGPTEEDVRRSETEFNLAVGLMEEHNFAGAFQHLEQAITLDRDNAEAELLLGNLYLFREDYGHAEEHLRQAIAANARVGNSGRPALVGEAQNSLGVVYIQSQRYPQAIEALREATGDLMYRTPHLAWGNLGWAYYEMHDYTEAMNALRQAVQLQPQFCGGWFRLGQVSYALGEAGTDATGFAHAEEALTHALEVDADECRALQDAWLLRGETRDRLGRHEDAIADFERCVELDGESEAGRRCQTSLAAAP